MVNWIPLNELEQVQTIIERSREVPCLIFKHSTSCSISSLVKYRIENNWDLDPEQLEVYFLDLIRFRSVSNFIADAFQVWHESPQILLIRNGDCTYHRSHLDISVDGIKDQLEATVNS